MKPLSRRKAAAYLGFSPNTLAAYEVKGLAPTHLRVGSTVRYEIAALNAWREARKAGGAS